MNRNFWDPQIPSYFTIFTQSGLVVELCLYSFAQSLKDEAKVRADVEGAAEIWCQSGINVQASHWERLGHFTGPSEPLDLNSRHLAEEMDTCDNLSAAALEQLFNLGRPHCPSPSEDNNSTNPSDIATQSVAVYYIPGARLHNVEFVQGCHRLRFPGGDGKPEHIILLTDEADARVLAHELGHALLTRKVVAGNWINTDPDPQHHPTDLLHNTNPQNLMSTFVAQNPVISTEQRLVAEKCHLISRKDLVFGFKPNRFELGVQMKTLHVHETNDEITSDDALESTWEFRVKNRLTANMHPFADSALGAGDHDLTSAGLDFFMRMDKPPDNLDTLTILVTGQDEDFGPNDTLPAVNKTWQKGTDLWGSGSSDPPGAPLGDHTDGPHTNEDEDINYSLTYNIRVINNPEVETILRTVCLPVDR